MKFVNSVLNAFKESITHSWVDERRNCVEPICDLSMQAAKSGTNELLTPTLTLPALSLPHSLIIRWNNIIFFTNQTISDIYGNPFP